MCVKTATAAFSSRDSMLPIMGLKHNGCRQVPVIIKHLAPVMVPHALDRMLADPRSTYITRMVMGCLQDRLFIRCLQYSSSNITRLFIRCLQYSSSNITRLFIRCQQYNSSNITRLFIRCQQNSSMNITRPIIRCLLNSLRISLGHLSDECRIFHPTTPIEYVAFVLTLSSDCFPVQISIIPACQ